MRETVGQKRDRAWVGTLTGQRGGNRGRSEQEGRRGFWGRGAQKRRIQQDRCFWHSCLSSCLPWGSFPNLQPHHSFCLSTMKKETEEKRARLAGCRVSSVVLVPGCVCSGAGPWHLHVGPAAKVGRASRSLKDRKAYGGLVWESLTPTNSESRLRGAGHPPISRCGQSH